MDYASYYSIRHRRNYSPDNNSYSCDRTRGRRERRDSSHSSGSRSPGYTGYTYRDGYDKHRRTSWERGSRSPDHNRRSRVSPEKKTEHGGPGAGAEGNFDFAGSLFQDLLKATGAAPQTSAPSPHLAARGRGGPRGASPSDRSSSGERGGERGSQGGGRKRTRRGERRGGYSHSSSSSGRSSSGDYRRRRGPGRSRRGPGRSRRGPGSRSSSSGSRSSQGLDSLHARDLRQLDHDFQWRKGGRREPRASRRRERSLSASYSAVSSTEGVECSMEQVTESSRQVTEGQFREEMYRRLRSELTSDKDAAQREERIAQHIREMAKLSPSLFRDFMANNADNLAALTLANTHSPDTQQGAEAGLSMESSPFGRQQRVQRATQNTSAAEAETSPQPNSGLEEVMQKLNQYKNKLKTLREKEIQSDSSSGLAGKNHPLDAFTEMTASTSQDRSSAAFPCALASLEQEEQYEAWPASGFQKSPAPSSAETRPSVARGSGASLGTQPLSAPRDMQGISVRVETMLDEPQRSAVSHRYLVPPQGDHTPQDTAHLLPTSHHPPLSRKRPSRWSNTSSPVALPANKRKHSPTFPQNSKKPAPARAPVNSSGERPVSVTAQSSTASGGPMGGQSEGKDRVAKKQTAGQARGDKPAHRTDRKPESTNRSDRKTESSHRSDRRRESNRSEKKSESSNRSEKKSESSNRSEKKSESSNRSEKKLESSNRGEKKTEASDMNKKKTEPSDGSEKQPESSNRSEKQPEPSDINEPINRSEKQTEPPSGSSDTQTDQLVKHMMEKHRRISAVQKELDALRKIHNDWLPVSDRGSITHPVMAENRQSQSDLSDRIHQLRQGYDLPALPGSYYSKTKAELKSAADKGGTRAKEESRAGHCCIQCQIAFLHLPDYLDHLRSNEHLKKYTQAGQEDLCPWQTADLKKYQKGAALTTIRGEEFVVTTEAFYCFLCAEMCSNQRVITAHLKSQDHHHKYQEYLSWNPMYDTRYRQERARLLSTALVSPPASDQAEQSDASNDTVETDDLLTDRQEERVETQNQGTHREEDKVDTQNQVMDREEDTVEREKQGTQREDDRSPEERDQKAKDEDRKSVERNRKSRDQSRRSRERDRKLGSRDGHTRSRSRDRSRRSRSRDRVRRSRSRDRNRRSRSRDRGRSRSRDRGRSRSRDRDRRSKSREISRRSRSKSRERSRRSRSKSRERRSRSKSRERSRRSRDRDRRSKSRDRRRSRERESRSKSRDGDRRSRSRERSRRSRERNRRSKERRSADRDTRSKDQEQTMKEERTEEDWKKVEDKGVSEDSREQTEAERSAATSRTKQQKPASPEPEEILSWREMIKRQMAVMIGGEEGGRQDSSHTHHATDRAGQQPATEMGEDSSSQETNITEAMEMHGNVCCEETETEATAEQDDTGDQKDARQRPEVPAPAELSDMELMPPPVAVPPLPPSSALGESHLSVCADKPAGAAAPAPESQYLSLLRVHVAETLGLEPDHEPPALPDLEPPTSPDLEISASPDLEPSESPDIEPPGSPDLEPPASPDLEPLGSPDLEPPALPDFEPPALPDLEQPASPDLEPLGSPDLEPLGSPEYGDEDMGSPQYDAEQPLQYDAEQPLQYDTEQPLQYDAEQPLQYDAEQPLQYDAEQPLQYDAEKPLQYDAEQPLQYDAEQPPQYDAEQPLQYDAEQPLQYDAEQPLQYDAEQPLQYDAEQPENLGGDKSACLGVDSEQSSLEVDSLSSLEVDCLSSLEVEESTSLGVEESTSLEVRESTSLGVEESTSLGVDAEESTPEACLLLEGEEDVLEERHEAVPPCVEDGIGEGYSTADDADDKIVLSLDEILEPASCEDDLEELQGDQENDVDTEDGGLCMGSSAEAQGDSVSEDGKLCVANSPEAHGDSVSEDGKLCMANSPEAHSDSVTEDGKLCVANSPEAQGDSVTEDGKLCMANSPEAHGDSVTEDGKLCVANSPEAQGDSVTEYGKLCMANSPEAHGDSITEDGKLCMANSPEAHGDSVTDGGLCRPEAQGNSVTEDGKLCVANSPEAGPEEKPSEASVADMKEGQMDTEETSPVGVSTAGGPTERPCVERTQPVKHSGEDTAQLQGGVGPETLYSAPSLSRAARAQLQAGDSSEGQAQLSAPSPSSAARAQLQAGDSSEGQAQLSAPSPSSAARAQLQEGDAPQQQALVSSSSQPVVQQAPDDCPPQDCGPSVESASPCAALTGDGVEDSQPAGGPEEVLAQIDSVLAGGPAQDAGADAMHQQTLAVSESEPLTDSSVADSPTPPSPLRKRVPLARRGCGKRKGQRGAAAPLSPVEDVTATEDVERKGQRGAAALSPVEEVTATEDVERKGQRGAAALSPVEDVTATEDVERKGQRGAAALSPVEDVTATEDVERKGQRGAAALSPVEDVTATEDVERKGQRGAAALSPVEDVTATEDVERKGQRGEAPLSPVEDVTATEDVMGTETATLSGELVTLTSQPSSPPAGGGTVGPRHSPSRPGQTAQCGPREDGGRQGGAQLLLEGQRLPGPWGLTRGSGSGSGSVGVDGDGPEEDSILSESVVSESVVSETAGDSVSVPGSEPPTGDMPAETLSARRRPNRPSRKVTSAAEESPSTARRGRGKGRASSRRSGSAQASFQGEEEK